MKVDIQANPLDQNIFSETAKQQAELCSKDDRHNKTTQIRKFYDELVMWNEKVVLHPEKYDEVAPYIQMLCAKVAYAKGRDLVDKDFLDLFTSVVQQIKDKETLKRAKLFFEAFIGFKKGFEDKKKGNYPLQKIKRETQCNWSISKR